MHVPNKDKEGLIINNQRQFSGKDKNKSKWLDLCPFSNIQAYLAEEGRSGAKKPRITILPISAPFMLKQMGLFDFIYKYMSSVHLVELFLLLKSTVTCLFLFENIGSQLLSSQLCSDFQWRLIFFILNKFNHHFQNIQIQRTRLEKQFAAFFLLS